MARKRADRRHRPVDGFHGKQCRFQMIDCARIHIDAIVRRLLD
jgi:hypothetical protein